MYTLFACTLDEGFKTFRAGWWGGRIDARKRVVFERLVHNVDGVLARDDEHAVYDGV
jgi:hypothetical protein